ncbi:MAG: hypothetical protein GX458_22625 [Phyllobacteriaceae bacterium]|nr:hypothetical protein [Phyllobacteriaceae bacterium]
MSTAVDITFRLVGLFYMASGVLVVRTLAVSAMADATWTAIMGKPPHPAERIREIWLAAGSVVIAAGGLALMLLLDVAAVLFVLGTAQQLIYLHVVAPRFLDPHDPPDPVGRARTRNAALIHLAVTTVVATAAAGGDLRAWDEQPTWLLAAAGAVVAVGAVWTIAAMRVRSNVGEAE